MGALELLFCVPILLQGIVTMIDEIFFHRRRVLPAWEIWGHPLDTLTVAAAYVFLLVAEPTQTNLVVYGALSVFSCLFVTKDELVHKDACNAKEQWLHSLLFLLHPTAFYCAGALWWRGATTPLQAQAALVLAFFLYQVLYWGKPWRQWTK